MSKKLDVIIDEHIKIKADLLFKDEEKNDNELITALKENLTSKIYDEIETEIKERVLSEAEEEINRRAGLKRIKEIRKLLVDGFLVSLFVGLFVNQITDLIGLFKDTSNKVVWGVCFSILFFVVCVAIFIYLFISEVMNFFGKDDIK